MWGIFDYAAFFNWILSNSLKASILVVLILLIKFLFKARIGARVQYLLWFVVIIGLLMPWAPKSSFSLYNLFQSDQYIMPPIVEQTPSLNLPGEISAVSEVSSQNKPDSEVTSTATPPMNGLATAVNSMPDVIKTLGQGTSAWSLNNILFSLWLIVACLLAGLTVFHNKTFSQKLDARLITDEGLISSLEEMKARLKVKSHIPLVQTSKVTTPSLYGIFRPMLLMPEKVHEKLTLDQVTYVFAHELCHFKRKDVLVNCLINALVILHWFNPIIWYMAYKMREDQEVSCDAYALSYIGNDKSNDYGYTLISLLESCTKARHVTGLTSLSGSRSQLKRRMTMLKMLGKASVKWTLLGLVIVIAISFTTLTNAKALVPTNATLATVVSTSKQVSQSNQSSTLPDGSFNYHKYLAFTPLLPSYTAGYQLTYSQIGSSQNIPPGNNSSGYLAAYGSHSAFAISESRPNESHLPVSGQAAKTQIQIGSFPATLTVDEKIGIAYIQFTKNDVMYTANNIPGGGVSTDELKKICESIAVPVNTPPTDIHIGKSGVTASDGLSFKTLQPGDLVVPQGFKFRDQSSQIYIKGDKKSEAFSLYYTTGKSSTFLNIMMTTGDQPYGFEPTPVLTPDSDFDTKQINGTTVKLRKTTNSNLPAAKFTISENGLEFTLFAPGLQQSEVQKMVTSVLQAYSKL